MTINLPRGTPIVMLAIMVALTSCTQVKETLQSANDKFHELTGSGSE